MNTIKLKFTGTSPYLMHSDRYANPLDPMTKAHKEITSKRKKTEEDQLAIARSEYTGSLYLDGDKVVVPTINIRASLIDGAKLNKLGTAFQKGTMILEEHVPLEHGGPRDWRKLFDNPSYVDCRSVVVSRARLMRYRPRFNDWSFTVEIVYDETIIDRDSILLSARNAGSFCGIGDYRPVKRGPFGRYEVEEV